jgi:glucose/arabinose dehydrogenase
MKRLGVLASTLVVGLALGACVPSATQTEEPTGAATDRPTDVSMATPRQPVLATPTEPAVASATEPPTQEPTVRPTRTTVTEATATPQAPFEPVVGLELVAEGLNAPVDLMSAGDGSGRLFIVDQIGLVRVLTAQGDLVDEPFLDIRDRVIGLRPGYDERGLLGLAFHPDYEENGFFYVYYSAPLDPQAPQGWNNTSHLSRFSVSQGNENRGDPGSETVILRVDEPQSNHDGGKIAFGPDGYLYVALGDGGGANDVGVGHVEDWYDANRGGNGQDVRDNLLGSILRIDVDAGELYGVPDDNPFVGREGLDEIWAYGFRNPYRFSFDAAGDRELFVADVGQNLWEEVSIVTRGGNYGWNVKEGSHCFSPATPNQSPETCPGADPDGNPLIDPIIEYQNGGVPGGLGLAVVGGYVYRGHALPGLEGRYVFGDWSRDFVAGDGTLFVATRPESEGSTWAFEELRIATSDSGRLGEFLLGFGQDADNELYAVTSGTPGPAARSGRVYKIVPAE